MQKQYVIKGQYDSYSIASEFGQGGMGKVHLAKNSKGHEVIVKTALITGDAADRLRAEKLKVEAAILKDLASFAHQNSVVKYIDEATQNNIYHLVIEKINGKTLDDVVGTTPLDEKTALYYISKILNSLKYIHGKNVIHRDVKPPNIIVDPLRGPILIDFGAGKQGWTQMGTAPGTIMYTPGWSCPHQIRGQLTSSCDLYSVGTVLLFMMTGKYPQHLMDSNFKLKRQPNQIRTGISQFVSDLITKTIDPDHKQITTADDILAYLQKQVTAPSQPYLIVKGRRVLLKNDIDIGRVHNVCDKNCIAVGYGLPPSIAIEEGKFKYISKHHARIWKDRNGYYWIRDLGSRNGTAISKHGVFRQLSPGQQEMLVNGTIVAICYNKIKGPYLTFTFHEK